MFASNKSYAVLSEAHETSSSHRTLPDKAHDLELILYVFTFALTKSPHFFVCYPFPICPDSPHMCLNYCSSKSGCCSRIFQTFPRQQKKNGSPTTRPLKTISSTQSNAVTLSTTTISFISIFLGLGLPEK